MPQATDPALYTLIYDVTQNIIASQNPTVVTIPAGTPLYRYVNYRGNPQTEAAARTIWSTAGNDIYNRWTGLPPAEGTQGASGLYLSMDEAGPQNTDFPELEHYQRQGPIEVGRQINYWEYSPVNQFPVMAQAQATQLRSMFIFTSNQNINGYDLTMPNPVNSPATPGPSLPIPSPLLLAIFTAAGVANHDLMQAKFVQYNPGVQDPHENGASSMTLLWNLYYDSQDASFSRAIGNAIFGNTQQIQFIKTTSVRNGRSVNVVAKGNVYPAGAFVPPPLPPQQPQPVVVQPAPVIDFLSTQGRGTFYMTVDSNAVYTIEDLEYNQILEDARQAE